MIRGLAVWGCVVVQSIQLGIVGTLSTLTHLVFSPENLPKTVSAHSVRDLLARRCSLLSQQSLRKWDG